MGLRACRNGWRASSGRSLGCCRLSTDCRSRSTSLICKLWLRAEPKRCCARWKRRSISASRSTIGSYGLSSRNGNAGRTVVELLSELGGEWFEFGVRGEREQFGEQRQAIAEQIAVHIAAIPLGEEPRVEHIFE